MFFSVADQSVHASKKAPTMHFTGYMGGGLFQIAFGLIDAPKDANWDKYNQQKQLNQYVEPPQSVHIVNGLQLTGKLTI